jgi:hypothetical protein
MKAWLLALIVLVLSCGVGAYYVGGSWTGLEGFADSPSGGNTPYLKKVAESKCETEYQKCMDVKYADNAACTKTYNACNTAAQGLDTSVSTVPNAPSSGTQFSAAGAVAYTKARDASMMGAGDATKWANSGDMLQTQTQGSSNPDTNFLAALREKMLKGYVPNKEEVAKAQGKGYFDWLEGEGDDLKNNLASYFSSKKTIKPHETPDVKPTPVTAKTHDKRGDDDDDDEGDSLRNQIRRDVNKAVHEEIEEIDNEYEIKYD